MFGNGSVMTEEGIVVEVIEDTTNMRGAHSGYQGPRQTGGGVQRGDLNIELRPHGVKLILIYPVAGDGVGPTIVIDHHLLFVDQSRTRFPVLGHRLGVHDVEMIMLEDRADIDILRVGLHRRFTEDQGVIDGVGIQDVVMIELDPLHLQKRLAHVPLEELTEHALLSYPLVPHHHPGLELIDKPAGPHPFQSHVRVQ